MKEIYLCSFQGQIIQGRAGFSVCEYVLLTVLCVCTLYLHSTTIYLFQVELYLILYPVFVHMYLELVYNQHEGHGKSEIIDLILFATSMKVRVVEKSVT